MPKQKLETIFDHDPTPAELREIFSWREEDIEPGKKHYLTKKRPDQDHNLRQDLCYLDISTLYWLRGDAAKDQEYRDKCKDQKLAKMHGFHYY